MNSNSLVLDIGSGTGSRSKDKWKGIPCMNR